MEQRHGNESDVALVELPGGGELDRGVDQPDLRDERAARAAVDRSGVDDDVAVVQIDVDLRRHCADAAELREWPEWCRTGADAEVFGACGQLVAHAGDGRL